MFAPVGLNALTDGTVTVHRVIRPQPEHMDAPVQIPESYCGTTLVEDEPVAEGSQDDPIDLDDELGVSCDTVDAALSALETSRLSPAQVAKEDQQILVRECDEVVLNYSLPVVARAIQFGERRTDVRSLGYGVLKHLKVLLHVEVELQPLHRTRVHD